MIDLTAVTSHPDVKGAVLGDYEGTLLQSSDDVDGESIAAVMVLFFLALRGAGEHLGFGELQRVSISGARQAAVVSAVRDGVLTALVDPPRSLAVAERFLESALASEV
jgi:predicted regulator of Ras-like GTPase activity (Roadblock/LC7/MglB family)